MNANALHTVALTAGLGIAFAALPAAAEAQTMPNNSAYLNAAIGSQLRMQRYGDMAVRSIFIRCYVISKVLRARGIDPGNCGATPQSASAAVARMGAAQQQYIQSTQRDHNAIYQTNDNFDRRVIQDCAKRVDAWGRPYWSCPNGTATTLTGN